LIRRADHNRGHTIIKVDAKKFCCRLSPKTGTQSSTNYAQDTARCNETKSVLVVWFVLLFVVLPLPVPADEVSVDKLIQFNVPEQRVDLALTQFAEQANITLLFPPDEMGELMSNELVGVYSVSEGANILLAATGLIPTFNKKLVLNIVLDRNKDNAETDMNNRKTTRGGLLGAVLSLFVTSGTQAEESAQVASSEQVIEEIVVTATKRDTSLQETTIAVTAITAEELFRGGIESAEDFARLTPGVALVNERNFGRWSIRGLNTDAGTSSSFQQRNATVYVDDIPVTQNSDFTIDLRLYDLERVEVLRGPQGTTFGSGSLAGAIRYITKKPDTSAFDASIAVDVASTSGGGIRQRYTGMVNVPLTDTLALRVVGAVRDEEGYVDNLGAFDRPGEKNADYYDYEAYRASLRWEPTDNLTATLMVMRDENESTVQGSNQAPGLGLYKRANIVNNPFELQVDIANLIVEYEFDRATLVSSTSWTGTDLEYDLELDGFIGFSDTFMPLPFSQKADQESFIQEIRLVSRSDGPLSWIVGAYYSDYEFDHIFPLHTTETFLDSQGVSYGGLPGPGPVLSSGMVTIDHPVGRTESEELALFGELNYQFTETLDLTVGVRYARHEFYNGNTLPGSYTTNGFDVVFGGGGEAVVVPPAAPTEGSTGKEYATTPKVSLRWRPTDSSTYYATVSKGYRRPHVNILVDSNIDPNDPFAIPPTVDEDTVWSYELGAKTQWLEGRLQANVAAYFIDWEDMQVLANRPSDGLGFISNAGDAESKGIEAELVFVPTERLALGLNLTMLDAEIVSIDQSDAITIGAVKGAELSSPDSKYSGFARYTWPMKGGNEVYARIDFQYAEGFYNGMPNVPGSITQDPNSYFAKTDSMKNVNLQVGWESEKLTVVLYGENILDNDDYIQKNIDNFVEAIYGTLRPRTIGLRLNWHY